MRKDNDEAPLPQRASFKGWWTLLTPFWRSEKRLLASCLLVLLLAITFSQSYVRLALTHWMGSYRQAISQYQSGALPSLLILYSEIFAVEIGVSLAISFLNASLGITWRTWLTGRFLQRWMLGKGFYWIEQERLVDNPDQRITEDIDLFVSLSLMLVLGLFGTMTSLFVFIPSLWRTSGSIVVHLGSHSMQVGHYMVWLAFLYAGVTSFVVRYAGARLQPLTFRKQQLEANFRFTMTGIRENAEQIALLEGGPSEVSRLQRRFEDVRRNFWQLMYFNLRFQPVTLAVALSAAVFASFALLPRYFAHQISFGEMTQQESAFAIVVSALQWFVQNFAGLQQYAVVVARLRGLDNAIRLGMTSKGPEYIRVRDAFINVTALALQTPRGRLLLSDASFCIRPGERWIIKGASGAGKSTLLRALAGIWHHGSGKVSVPIDGKVLFLPQKSYLPSGSLKAAICYPGEVDAFGNAQCRSALKACHLASYAHSLDEVADWGQRLSPGEQQRLGFARVLLQAPNYVLMDESTSALDAENEAHLYRLLLRRLPFAAIVSVSHHRALDQYHDHTLALENGQALPFKIFHHDTK